MCHLKYSCDLQHGFKPSVNASVKHRARAHLILQNFTDSKNQNIQIGAIIMDFANAVGIIVSFTN